MAKNYYKELDKRIRDFELGRQTSSSLLHAIADKIYWCNKWKKITTEQLHELCDRVTNIVENYILEY